MTIQKMAQLPEWVANFFAEIDSKRFGPAFEACFAPDAEMIFGVTHLRGFSAIKAHLMEFDAKMETKHVVIDFWEAGNTRFLRGEVRMTKHASPERTVTPAFVHVWHMADGDPPRVRRMHGAVGPME